MSGRRGVPETFGEFLERRFRELQESAELAQFGEMYLSKFVKMIEGEFYDRADDPAPASAPTLQ
jgi:hypothetical protein